jgi:DNA polymerase V
MFALIDGHNFYVSCERLFRPSLIGVPVIVLSNNDGCAIARSEEAKRLGVTMGMPWFQIRKELGNAGIVALSANFSLYGDLSNRMMSVAAGLGPTQECIRSTRALLVCMACPAISPPGPIMCVTAYDSG